jgi:hypothetical protein
VAPLALIVLLAALAGEPRDDDVAGARARVESLYAAGSLPEALAAAREGLRSHADDPILLRRACQLALSLRAPEIARGPSERLSELVRGGDGFEPGSLDAWRTEAAVLARELAELESRERAVEAATFRARTVSLSVIAVLGLGLFALAKRSRPLP